jgi:homoserine O-succinyltransferase/O-acetyltransferase
MIRIAILDLYNGAENQGMRCIRQIIREWSEQHATPVIFDEFDVRRKNELPDLSYDVFISSGGPGSPWDGEGEIWEKNYFDWVASVEEYNKSDMNAFKKNIFFICHSFQIACRYFGIGEVVKRKSTAFGVFPVHVLMEGQQDPIFEGLPDPFYVVDSRDWQVIKPAFEKMKEQGAQVLCIEKYRPHVPLDQAIMSFRFNEYMIGTQFHPEADAEGMSIHLQTEEKKKIVIEQHGEAKWSSMIEQLNDPDKIMFTYSHVLPNFLTIAAKQYQLAEA